MKNEIIVGDMTICTMIKSRQNTWVPDRSNMPSQEEWLIKNTGAALRSFNLFFIIYLEFFTINFIVINKHLTFTIINLTYLFNNCFISLIANQ